MADFGIQVLSASLNVQVDGKYRNFALWKDGSEFRSATGAPWLIATMGELAVADMPFISMKAQTATPIVFEAVDNTPPVGSLNRIFVGFPYTNSLTLKYQIFKPGVAKVADYGLLVTNTNGTQVFSSEDKHLNPIAEYSATLGYTNVWASVNITVRDADSNYFALYPQVENRTPQPPSSHNFTKRGFKKVDSTTIRVVNFNYDYGPGIGGPGRAWVATFNLVEMRKE